MREFCLFAILTLFRLTTFGQVAPEVKKAHQHKIDSFAFDSSQQLENGFSKVSFNTGLLASQGIFDTKSKKYLIDANCDSIKILKRNEKTFYKIFRDSLQGLISGNGKIIVPFASQKIDENPFFQNYWLVDSQKYQKEFSTLKNFSVYDANGSILLKNVPIVYKSEIPDFVISADKDNFYSLIDLKTAQKVLSGYDAIQSILLGEEQDGSSAIYIVASKKGKSELFTFENAKLERTKDFDYLLSDLNVIPNEINVVANLKRNLGDWERERSHNFAVVTKNGRFGIYDFANRNFLAETVYDSISPWGNVTVSGKRTNLIYGKPISEPKMYFPKGVVFEENGKFGVMDASGKVKLEATYDYIEEINQGIFKLREKRKFGLYFMSENKTIAPKFDHIDPNLEAYRKQSKIDFNNDGTIYKIQTPDKTRFETIGEEQHDSFSSWSKYTENNKDFGLADSLWNKVTPAVYKDIYAIGRDHFAIVSKEGTGVISKSGKIILKPEFAVVQKLSENGATAFFAASKSDRFGIFDASGKQIFPFSYQYQDFLVSDSQKTYLLVYNKEFPEKRLIRLDSEGATILAENLYSATVNQNREIIFTTLRYKHGFVDLESGKVVPAQFDKYLFGKDHIIVQKNGKFDSYLDSDFELKPLVQSFDEVISNHWNYIFTQNGKQGILRQDFKIENFRHDNIESAVRFASKNYFTERDFEIGSRYFRFSDNPNGSKVGIIASDGKIIVKNDFYDAVEFPVYGEKSQLPNYLEKYRNAFFVGTRNLDKARISVDLIPLDGKTKIRLEAPIDWKFSLTDISESGLILVRDKDSTTFYDLETGKRKFSIAEPFLNVDTSGGYSNVPAGNNNYQSSESRFQKYSFDGMLLLDTITKVYVAQKLFSKQNFIVRKNGRYGIANIRKNLVVPKIYKEIIPVDDNYFACRKNELYGLIDANGIVQIDFLYDKLSYVADNSNTSKNAFFLTSKNGKYGLLSQNLKQILDEEFTEISVGRKLIAAEKDGFLYAFEPTGKLVWKNKKDDSISRLSDMKSFIDYNSDLRFWRTKPDVDEIRFAADRHRNPRQFWSFKLTEETLPNGVNQFSRTYKSGGYTKMFYITFDGKKYGLSDKNLKTIIAPQYDQVSQIIDSRLVIVTKNKLEGVIDFSGKTIIPFLYDSIDYDESTQLFECQKNERSTFRTEFDVVVGKRRF